MRRNIPVFLPESVIPCSDIEALQLPEDSFIARYMDYAASCTDAPRIYHLGVGLGILAVAAGNCDIMITSADGARQDIPIRLWSAIVGNSGQRKSEAMDLGVDLLKKVGIEFSLPQDASVEAWHDALGANPIALLQLDELSSMFDAASRSWSQGLKGWMLQMWSGRDRDRLTKAGGREWVRRPRFNVLGGIPQDVLEKKTNRSDWRSGLLPRFCFWHGKRTQWAETWAAHPKLEQALANWLGAVPVRSKCRIELPYHVVKPINEWFFNTVEVSQDDINPDLFSALTRLQEKAFLFAGLMHLACQSTPIVPNCANAIAAHPAHGTVALDVVRILRQVVEGIFGVTASDPERRDEDEVKNILSQAKIPLTVQDVTGRVGFSNKKCRRILEELASSGWCIKEFSDTKSRGRPAATYKAYPSVAVLRPRPGKSMPS